MSHALMVPGKVGHEELDLVLPPTRTLQLPVHLDNLGTGVQPCLCLGVIGPFYLLPVDKISRRPALLPPPAFVRRSILSIDKEEL